MRLFTAQLLLISTAGNLLSVVIGDCGGKAEVLEERNGSIWFSFPTGLYSHNLTFDDTPGDTENVTCTWIINARENQTVWIDVVHLDEDTSLRITFSNKTVKEHAKGTLVAGIGRTTVEWSWRNYTRAPELSLRWNMSEDGRDLTWVLYKHSDSDPVSPPPDTPNRANRPADILGFDSAASPSVHTLWDLRAQQGGGVSASDDKNEPLIPQEGRHNGQEAAGAAISDLAHSVTHSWTESNARSTLSYTHEKRHMTTPTLPFSKSPPHTMTGRYEVAMATRNDLNRETDDAFTDMQTTDPKKKTAVKIYPDGHNGALLNTVSVASPQTVRLAESFTEALALKTVSKEQGSYTAPESDITMTTSTDESVSLVTSNQPHATTLAGALGMEIDQTSGSPRLTQPNQDLFVQTHTSIFDDSNTIPDGTHDLNVSTFSPPQNASESPSESPREEYTHTPNTQPTLTVHSLHPTSNDILHTIQSDAQQTSSTVLPSTTNQAGSTDTPDHDTHHTADPSSAFPPSVSTTPSNLPQSSTSLTLASPSPNTVRQGREREMSSASSTLSFDVTTPWVRLTSTPELTVQNRFTTEESLHNTSEQESDGATFTHNTETFISETQSYRPKQQKTLANTLGPHIFHKYATEPDTVIPQYTNIPQTESSGNDISVSLGPMIPVSVSPSASGQTGSMKAAHGDTDGLIRTERNDPVTPTTPSPVISLNSVNSTAGEDVSTSTPSQWGASQTPAVSTPLMTTPWAKITPTPSSHHLTSSQNGAVLHTHFPTKHPRTSTPASLMSTNFFQGQTESQTPSAWTQTSSVHSITLKTDNDWLHKRRVFIVEDQPAVIKVETFQVLLQVVLDGNSPSYVDLEVEPILHKVAGYQSQQVTWHSGPVLQMVVTFRTVEALPWLGRVESLLHEAGLSPLPRDGIFVGGVRVKNITIGGLHTDVCTWLFMCPSGFQCMSSEGNASCRSLCHSEYCKHHGICVHRPGQQPMCQCPVGEDFWFMGQRCDLRMTRQRLVGVCFGVLLAAAALMAVLSYLAVRRFKSMLVQAKVDQTRSSYRRFNHFDELSARFWGRSWPGSEDSLDNPGFTRSDELLHMRALDRTCCYHDDTLSIASTYQDSVSQLNTVYPHSSQYRWDLSNYSLADCVVDSGKASDLSVCSWPIEPIQWTPFPLLQQLSRNTASVKSSRPRSYCEGMELVDLEKSWTA